MAGPTFDALVFAYQCKTGLLSMVKSSGFPRTFRVAGLALGWLAKAAESISMGVVFSMTSGAGRARFASTALLRVALETGQFSVTASQIELGSSFVIKGISTQRTILRGVTPVARLLVKEHALVRRTMTSRIAAVARFGAFEIELCSRMALGARYIFVGALLGKFCMALFVVVKIQSTKRRLPGHLGMAAFALQHGLAIKAMRLIALVTGAAEFVFAEVEATPGLVGLFVTAFAVDHFVFVFESPACQFVVKALLAPANGSPTHHVVTAPFVF